MAGFLNDQSDTTNVGDDIRDDNQMNLDDSEIDNDLSLKNVTFLAVSLLIFTTDCPFLIILIIFLFLFSNF